MTLLPHTILSVAVELPTIAVLTTGMVLASARRERLSRRARALLTSGAAVLLVVALVTLTWNLVLRQLMTSDWVRDGGYQRISLLSLALSGFIAVGHPIGYGLLIGAVLAGRKPAEPPPNPWDSWTGPLAGSAPFEGASGAGAAAKADEWAAPDLPTTAPGPQLTRPVRGHGSAAALPPDR